MGAYSIRPSGAARLLRLLQHSPPDVSRLVLDVWVARQVVDERAGLTACVWNTTNQIFQHGDERISLRRGFNGGIDRLGGDLLRLWRGGNDAAGHPLWLSRTSFLLRRFDDVIGPLHTPKAACVRLKSCWMALGFWRCASLGGVSPVLLECVLSPDGPSILYEILQYAFWPLIVGALALVGCCHWRRGRRPSALGHRRSPSDEASSPTFRSLGAIAASFHRRTPSEEPLHLHRRTPSEEPLHRRTPSEESFHRRMPSDASSGDEPMPRRTQPARFSSMIASPSNQALLGGNDAD